MRYEILGDTLPVVQINLNKDEQIICQAGAMNWMTPNVVLNTTTNGFARALGRKMTGESFFMNRYTSLNGPGIITIGTSFPGKIVPFVIRPGESIILQKRGFLCCEPSVKISLFMQRSIRSGFFSGEGFALQKLSGEGLAFAEISGYACSYDLEGDDCIVMESGSFAAATGNCRIDVVSTGGVKNALFSGEGLFNTVVMGPGGDGTGTVYIQSMSMLKLSSRMADYFRKNNSGM